MKLKNLLLIVLVIVVVLVSSSIAIGANQTSIEIAGSTSVQPLMEKLSEEYCNNHSNVKINVQGGCSGMGIRSSGQGIADIGMSSKNLTENESEGLEIVELGKEGIVIGVNNENKIDDLSIDDIRKIFSGEITNWKEIGGDDKEIHLIVREDGSGTRDAFDSLVMKDSEVKKDAIVQSSTESVKQAVSSDPNAIGYVSLAHMSDDIKGISVEGVEASTDTILNGDYELQRPFIIIFNNETASDDLKDFINWIKSDEGKKIIEEEKIVPSV